MTVLLVGGPHNGRELKGKDIYTDNNADAEPIMVLNVESLHDKNIVDVYTFHIQKTPGVTEFLYHSSRKLK